MVLCGWAVPKEAWGPWKMETLLFQEALVSAPDAHVVRRLLCSSESQPVGL